MVIILPTGKQLLKLLLIYKWGVQIFRIQNVFCYIFLNAIFYIKILLLSTDKNFNVFNSM